MSEILPCPGCGNCCGIYYPAKSTGFGRDRSLFQVVYFHRNFLIVRQTSHLSNHLTVLYSLGRSLLKYAVDSLRVVEMQSWLDNEERKTVDGIQNVMELWEESIREAV